ncbi:hypothetical protein OH491_19140 [Termitidicoccus mucosus]|uniref:P-type conjugative transfer protein TrbJ n=1 Tax=Termitidicoccus mucosus TaxID=1184151 RepID=A0A178IL72_9BACT|nr:hypothetical protein AW736_09490 [Opitutaceae bacterium TSB47]
MKTSRILTVSTVLICISSVLLASGIPVFDGGNLANNQIMHIATIAKWVDSIAQLKTQIQQMKEQAGIQNDIRSWAGDPSKAARSLLLDVLRESDLNHEYGEARNAITQAVNSLDVLTRDDRHTYRPVDEADLDGGDVWHDPQLYRRYSLLDARQENARVVSDETRARELELQEEIALTLLDLRSAGTDAQVQKLTAKLTVLNGQLAQLESTRRRQVDEVILQKLANENRREVEQLAAAELQAKDDYLANKHVTTFMQSFNPRKSGR